MLQSRIVLILNCMRKYLGVLLYCLINKLFLMFPLYVKKSDIEEGPCINIICMSLSRHLETLKWQKIKINNVYLTPHNIRKKH